MSPLPTDAKTAITFIRTVPILRIFSVEKAKEFYRGFLGFSVDWEHTFEPGMPVYMQVSRAGLQLHLSEHHGDGSPGVHIHVEMTGVPCPPGRSSVPRARARARLRTRPAAARGTR